MSYNVTVEVLDRFSKRLHVNTALNFIINIPAMYLILFHSTKAMGFYKYYLLYSVILTFIVDIYQTTLYGMYILLPSLINCCSGYCRHFGMAWGPRMNYMIMNINTSAVAISLISLSTYRYCSICGKLKWLQSKYSILGFFIVGIVYPIPVISALLISTYNMSYEELFDRVNREYPEYLSLVKLNICSMFKNHGAISVYIMIVALQIILGQTVGLTLACKTTRLLISVRNSLSKATYVAQKQFLISVWLQILMSLCAVIIPIFLMLFIFVLKIRHSYFISEIAVHMMTLRAPLNGLVIIWSIKSYRTALKKLFIFKSSSSPIAAVAVVNTDSFLR